MTEIEGIEQIAQAATAIQIDGPLRDGRPSNDASDITAAVAAAKVDLPPSAPTHEQLEQRLAREMGDGIDSVTIEGPDGTRGAEAIHTVIENVTGEQDEGLFDAAAYVAVPEVDGQTADKIVIAFTGQIAYDATDEQGAALYESLHLGKAVELRVAGVVAGKAGAYKVTARDEEVVTGKATIKVDTLYLLTPESL